MRFSIFLVVIIMSCKSKSGFVTVDHVVYEGDKYRLKIPSGYNFKGSEAGVEKENIYIYPDSIYVYVTDFKHTPNANNIKALGDSVFQLRFQNEDLIKAANKAIGKEVVKALPDTFELSGLDRDGKYWKDIKIGKTSVGYGNVPKEELLNYEKVMSSFRRY